MSTYTAISICLFTVILIPFQGVINSRFAGVVESTYFIGGISALIASVLRLIMFMSTNPSFNFQAKLTSLPIYFLPGGFLLLPICLSYINGWELSLRLEE